VSEYASASRADQLFEELRLRDRDDDERFRGTLAPFFRASDNPMAMACLRLLTVLPLRPLFSDPRFIRCMADFTFLPAEAPYLRLLLRFFVAIPSSFRAHAEA